LPELGQGHLFAGPIFGRLLVGDFCTPLRVFCSRLPAALPRQLVASPYGAEEATHDATPGQIVFGYPHDKTLTSTAL
jgi:hypothetical protein